MPLQIFFIPAFICGAATALYLFVLAFNGRFRYQNRFGIKGSLPSARIAVLVPGYKEDGIIVSTAKSLLLQDYPKDLYDVYIIADSFQPGTLRELSTLPVHVLEVSFEKSTKTKALNEAFSRINKTYELALILDADNIPANNFLLKMNAAWMKGAKAIQGRRVAKNLDTSFAILDACSEGINNNIFRKGANASGLTSSVIGSGMAFDYDLVKEILSGIKAVGGFDKILQLEIVKKGYRIEYIEDALVFDEKVDSSQAFHQQRKRWVSSQFIYLKKFFGEGIRQLFKGNFSYFDLAIVKNLILPRAFLFILFPALFLFSFWMGTAWIIASLLISILYMASMLLAIPTELVNKDLFAAISRLPQAIMLMVAALFGIKKANQSFIHTIHTKTEINNPLFHEHNK
jgi:cellulose synthase/poly-beta-1,6-N-acetylglucosamine synthase-like glycosyltransferase